MSSINPSNLIQTRPLVQTLWEDGGGDDASCCDVTLTGGGALYSTATSIKFLSCLNVTKSL